MSIQRVSFGNANFKKVFARKIDKMTHVDLTNPQTCDAVRTTWQRIGIRQNPNIIVRADEPFDVTYAKAIIPTPNGTKVLESKTAYPLKKRG